MPDAARSIVVICEGPADRRTACELADRVLCKEIGWFSPELLGSFRRWRGLRSGEAFLAWKDIPRLARDAGVRTHGHFNGYPGEQDAWAARLALALLAKEAEQGFDAVVLIRDSDGVLQRREGLEQARSVTPGTTIVIGFAHAKRECWILAGFAPRDEAERTRLETARRELGFDPTKRAEELDATAEEAKRSAKRVLKALLGGDLDREATCWTEPSLELLIERGKGAGLADFLGEVRDRLVPLWTGRRP